MTNTMLLTYTLIPELLALAQETKSQRDLFVKELIDNKMLCNPTRDKTIRLRPNLCVTSDEVNHALSIIQKYNGECMNELLKML